MLVIAVSVEKAEAESIRKDGAFPMLGGLVEGTLTRAAWNIGRQAKAALPPLQALGERSAQSDRAAGSLAVGYGGLAAGVRRVLWDDYLFLLSDRLPFRAVYDASSEGEGVPGTSGTARSGSSTSSPRRGRPCPAPPSRGTRRGSRAPTPSPSARSSRRSAWPSGGCGRKGA